MKIFLLCVALMLSAWSLRAEGPVEASPPQGVTISVYDVGLGLINEARRVTLGSGENTILLRGLPSRVDPSSMSYATVTRSAPFDVLDQTLEYDLTDAAALLARMAGLPVTLDTASGAREGIVLGPPVATMPGEPALLPVKSRDGAQLWMLGMDDLSSATFSTAGGHVAVEPQARWRVRARETGPQNFRLTYRTGGLSWRAHYELMLAPAALQADFLARVELVNDSGGRYDSARVRLLSTEKGLAEPVLPEPRGSAATTRPAMRYAYGATEPAFERTVASLAPVEVYELPQAIDMMPGRSTFVHYMQAVEVPIKRFFVYDGVRFDRFQRNIRTDWNYGTESQEAVQLHVEFGNEKKFGLGMNLPPGLCRVYQVRADGMIDLLGEEPMIATATDSLTSVRVGPAAGLRGQRERTGYTEIRPHHVYEETFQIRLSNATDEKVDIRVVEHLYRGPDFEITRSDAEYTRSGPQTIEFTVPLDPAVRRAISYTVRYSW